MVVMFIPRGNDSDVCSGVVAYNAARPPQSKALADFAFAVFWFGILLNLGSLPIVFWLRNEPRFRMVRPFFMTAYLMVSSSFFATAYALPEVFTGIPCAYVLFFYVTCIGGAGGLLFTRSVIVTVEGQYAALALRSSPVVQVKPNNGKIDSSTFSDDNDTIPGSVSTLFMDGHSQRDCLITTFKSWKRTFSTVFAVLQFGVGFRSLDHFKIMDLMDIRRSYKYVLLAAVLPAVAVVAVIIAVVPPYQSCTDCSVFAEFIIGAMVVTVIAIALLLRVMWVMRTERVNDEQEITYELFAMVLICGALVFLCLVLIIIDPYELYFNRVFAWPLITGAACFYHWYYCVGLQVFRALQQRRALQSRLHRDSSFSSHASSETPDMIVTCEHDEELRKSFHAFAAGRYVIESVNFLQDIASYHKYFHEKGLSWRVSKARVLIDTYIRSNASQEVNISSGTKMQILQQASKFANNGANVQRDLFDAAYKEVDQMITNDVWIEFWLKQTRQSLRRSKTNSKRLDGESGFSGQFGLTLASDVQRHRVGSSSTASLSPLSSPDQGKRHVVDAQHSLVEAQTDDEACFDGGSRYSC